MTKMKCKLLATINHSIKYKFILKTNEPQAVSHIA